jgi:protein-export membrane protein SecD
MWKTRIFALLVFVVAAMAGFFNVLEYTRFADSSWTRPFRLGLDLQGGAHLVYNADVGAIPSGDANEAMQGLRDVIERRINAFGVSEPVVQTEKSGSQNRLIVELAGVFDINQAIQAIGETPFLEFRILPPGLSESATTTFASFVPTPLNGRYLKRAVLNFDQTSSFPSIGLEFNSEGSALFEKLTESQVGKPLAIFLDGVPLSAPVVREKISGGQAQITGDFSVDDARQLVRRLNAGALPVPISLISQQSVQSTLGSEALLRSLRAGVYGTIAVMIFMIGWYRLPGLIAVLALGVYSSLVLALFKVIPVTLSSAGIAGFILSIGMAVDANILIFERMKEELREGKSLDVAMTEGFRRAWTSIRDSNVSSLITSVILYYFGTSVVRGFALTLFIGIVVSMFTAITASRLFLRSLPHGGVGRITRFFFGSGIHNA